MNIILCVAAWLVVSLVLARMISGQDEEALVDVWSAVFLLVPLALGYGLIYLLARVLFSFPLWRRKVTVDDIV